MMPYGEIDLGDIGSGNVLLPDSTKPLPESMLTDHQVFFLVFLGGGVYVCMFFFGGWVGGGIHVRTISQEVLKNVIHSRDYTFKITNTSPMGQ